VFSFLELLLLLLWLSLHDFMLELNREWTKFRNGTLIGLISSGVLFLFVVSLILRTRSLSLGLLDFSLLLIAGALLGYSIYAMHSQYRFFSRWKRRVGLLIQMARYISKIEIFSN